ncbi:hypothetical protein [Zavarzinella formosa]|uniref:hypothetical protein n=1 Tax=Zavarzinella formosa TaxID=360055 RepID=UPI0002FBE90A|nr:hypothetical protein [Zavarzinella formosa]
MFALTRRQARLLRAAVRRCASKRRPRGPDTVLRMISGKQGTFVFVRLEEAAIGCRLPTPPAQERHLAIPLELLARIEGSDDSPVTVEAASTTEGRAAWTDRGLPKSATFHIASTEDAGLPAMPSTFADTGRSLLEALHEAGRCATNGNACYDLTRLQIRGSAGQVIGTDARQALVMGGFAFPFDDDLLVPAVPLFGMREWAGESHVRVGRTPTGLCVGIGEWLVWLTEEREARFPDVGSVLRRNGGVRLKVGDDDAAALLAGLPKMPGAGDEHAPVTIGVGPSCCVRARENDAARPVELRLADSIANGPATAWTIDRRYLHRALLLGFREFSSRKAGDSLLAANGPNSYLFAQLDQSSMIGSVAVDPQTSEPTASPAASKPALSLIQRRTDMKPPDPRPGPEPNDGEPNDPLAEAEALRAMLGEALARSSRLVASLKSHRRQRKAIESAWSSLQQLKLGTGG